MKTAHIKLNSQTDYYAAPDCNALCSSGSGTPKANGTQECLCNNKVYSIRFYCMSDGYCDSYKTGTEEYRSEIIRGQFLENFVTWEDYFSSNGMRVWSAITLQGKPDNTSDLRVKINGTVYVFKYAYDNRFYSSSRIFRSNTTYSIEFLN